MGHPDRIPAGTCRRSWLSLVALALALAALGAAGCKVIHRADTRPLDGVGMSFSAIEQLQQLDVTNPEVAELVKVKQVGFSDDAAVALVRAAHGRNQRFTAGDAVMGLVQAGFSEKGVLELGRLDQLGLWVGEAQAMRLAGIPEPVILELARQRAAGRPTLSGPSLAEMKNTGMSDETLFELARHAVPDTEAKNILLMRQRRWSDAQILRHYSSQ
jgi:hypothetical protein